MHRPQGREPDGVGGESNGLLAGAKFLEGKTSRKLPRDVRSVGMRLLEDQAERTDHAAISSFVEGHGTRFGGREDHAQGNATDRL